MTPTPILADVESQSRADLKACGGRRYWDHPSTRVLCIAWHDTRTGKNGMWRPGERWPHHGRQLAAHNATFFDRFAFVREGFMRADDHSWIDTSELARANGLPGKLEALGHRWLGLEKDKEASRFTTALSTVRRPTKKSGAEISEEAWSALSKQEKRERGVLPEYTQAARERVEPYCALDVEIMTHGWTLLEDWADLEPDVLEMDRSVNDRGVFFDVELAEALLECDAINGEQAMADLAREIGGGWTARNVRDVANSPEQFVRYTGLLDATAQTVEATLLDPDAPALTLILCRARQAIASIERGKLQAGLARVSDDGRLRDMMRYYGAHAQPLSEPIHTPTGWTTMGELRVGSVVSGRRGPTRLIAVYPQGLRPVFRVTFSDGSWTRCDADHLWEVRTADGYMRVIRTGDFGSLTRKSGRHKYFIPMVDPAPEKRASLPIDPYTLGAMLGDGCLTQSVPRFTSNDPEIVDRFILPEGVTIHRVSVKGKRASHYTFPSGIGGRWRTNPFADLFRTLGLWGLDSFTKFIPNQYLCADPASRLELLRGLLDTDGSAKSPGVAKFATCSQALADGVVELVQSLGGTVTSAVGKVPSGGIYEIDCNMPAGVIPFHLERKAKRWPQSESRKPFRAIVSVTPDGSEECQCIEVDAADHLYVTRDFIVTHNTGRWSGVGMQLHNLPRPHKRYEKWTDDDICRIADSVKCGDHIATQDEISLLVRACLTAAPGFELAPCDFSSIEARATAWAAGDDAALDVFRSGKDPYKVAGGFAFGIPYEQVDDEQRGIGKRAELGCGYGAGGDALRNMARKEAGLDLDAKLAKANLDADGLVAMWRKLHGPIVKLWYALNDAFAVAASGESCKVSCFDFVPSSDGRDVAIFLPSGRPIVYPEVHCRWVQKRAKNGREYRAAELSYLGTKFREHIYGGKICENVIQALCRDLLAVALVKAERAGLRPVLHVHDEGVPEVPRGTGKEALEYWREIMLDVPDWAKGMPMGAKGFFGLRYRK